MPGVTRQGDVTFGHCFPPVPPTSWSSVVTCNNLGVVRKGDPYEVHCCGIPCHQGSANGSHNVTVEGRDIQLHGDPLTCGDSINACSGNVTACG